MIDGPLPANLDAERFVLGGILVDDSLFVSVLACLDAADFSLEKNRRIFGQMKELHAHGEPIDYITTANALKDIGQLESVDGLTYLTSLAAGMPQLPNLDAWVRIVRDKAMLRRIIFGAQQLSDRAMSGDGAGDVLEHAEGLLKGLGQFSPVKWATPGDVMETYPGGLNKFLNPTRGGNGIPTPWPKVTEMLCGFQAGDLVLIGGRPSMGKSAAALQIALHTAKQDRAVAFVSLEMSKEALVQRLIAIVGGLDLHRLRGGYLDQEERLRAQFAAAEIADLPLFIDETRARTMPALEARIRRLRAEREIGLVIIDHLQLMRGMARAESRHQELSAISHDLKHLAVDFGVPVILLSQLNRECERERRLPQLSDLKETGSLEEDADVVLFIHRAEQYKRDDPSLHGLADLIVGKQRNGPVGKIAMTFTKACASFGERTTTREENHE